MNINLLPLKKRSTLGYIGMSELYYDLSKYKSDKSFCVLGLLNNIEICNAIIYYVKPHVYEIADLYLDDEHRGQGLAKKFINLIINHFINNNIILWTTSDNIAANKLYLSLNFVPINKKEYQTYCNIELKKGYLHKYKINKNDIVYYILKK